MFDSGVYTQFEHRCCYGLLALFWDSLCLWWLERGGGKRKEIGAPLVISVCDESVPFQIKQDSKIFCSGQNSSYGLVRTKNWQGIATCLHGSAWVDLWWSGIALVLCWRGLGLNAGHVIWYFVWDLYGIIAWATEFVAWEMLCVGRDRVHM